MIVCHCNRIASEAIERATSALSETDPWRMLTPVLVYRTLGIRPRCGGCLPQAAQIIHCCLAERRACGARCPFERAEEAEPEVCERVEVVETLCMVAVDPAP
jgi:bacterioferritin-associated ferredoxin